DRTARSEAFFLVEGGLWDPDALRDADLTYNAAEKRWEPAVSFEDHVFDTAYRPQRRARVIGDLTHFFRYEGEGDREVVLADRRLAADDETGWYRPRADRKVNLFARSDDKNLWRPESVTNAAGIMLHPYNADLLGVQFDINMEPLDAHSTLFRGLETTAKRTLGTNIMPKFWATNRAAEYGKPMVSNESFVIGAVVSRKVPYPSSIEDVNYTMQPQRMYFEQERGEVFEPPPNNYLVLLNRTARWVRGEIQTLPRILRNLLFYREMEPMGQAWFSLLPIFGYFSELFFFGWLLNELFVRAIFGIKEINDVWMAFALVISAVWVMTQNKVFWSKIPLFNQTSIRTHKFYGLFRAVFQELPINSSQFLQMVPIGARNIMLIIFEVVDNEFRKRVRHIPPISWLWKSYNVVQQSYKRPVREGLLYPILYFIPNLLYLHVLVGGALLIAMFIPQNFLLPWTGVSILPIVWFSTWQEGKTIQVLRANPLVKHGWTINMGRQETRALAFSFSMGTFFLLFSALFHPDLVWLAWAVPLVILSWWPGPLVSRLVGTYEFYSDAIKQVDTIKDEDGSLRFASLAQALRLASGAEVIEWRTTLRHLRAIERRFSAQLEDVAQERTAPTDGLRQQVWERLNAREQAAVEIRAGAEARQRFFEYVLALHVAYMRTLQDEGGTPPAASTAPAPRSPSPSPAPQPAVSGGSGTELSVLAQREREAGRIPDLRGQVEERRFGRFAALLNRVRAAAATEAYPADACILCERTKDKAKEGLTHAWRDYEHWANDYPIVNDHLLLVTKAHEPQGVSEQNLRDWLEHLSEYPDYLLFYNHAGAGASATMHRHAHLIPATYELPVESAATQLLGKRDGVTVSELTDWPAEGLVLEGRDVRALASLQSQLLVRLEAYGVAYNFVVKRLPNGQVRVFLYPRSQESPSPEDFTGTFGAMEMSGWIVGQTDEDKFNRLTQEVIERGIREVSVSDETWRNLRSAIRVLLQPVSGGSGEVRRQAKLDADGRLPQEQRSADVPKVIWDLIERLTMKYVEGCKNCAWVTNTPIVFMPGREQLVSWDETERQLVINADILTQAEANLPRLQVMLG
ncbi:MAG: DUF4922 domain-containing protein, partial [Candidatus Omnitrophota bacterium]|nr:DUF4922 domain-containing protein [Candidatus Omnitrophota bacterium]